MLYTHSLVQKIGFFEQSSFQHPCFHCVGSFPKVSLDVICVLQMQLDSSVQQITVPYPKAPEIATIGQAVYCISMYAASIEQAASHVQAIFSNVMRYSSGLTHLEADQINCISLRTRISSQRCNVRQTTTHFCLNQLGENAQKVNYNMNVSVTLIHEGKQICLTFHFLDIFPTTLGIEIGLASSLSFVDLSSRADSSTIRIASEKCGHLSFPSSPSWTSW